MQGHHINMADKSFENVSEFKIIFMTKWRPDKILEMIVAIQFRIVCIFSFKHANEPSGFKKDETFFLRI